MTSSVRIAAPFSRVAPSWASKATTVPGKGATILSSPICSSVSPPNGSDPMQLEAAVWRAQVELMAFQHGEDVRLHTVEREIEAAVIGRSDRKASSCAPSTGFATLA